MSPNQQVAWRQSTLRITRVHPPYPARYDQHTVHDLPAHDPAAARAVVAALSTVAAVAEELPPVLRQHTGHPRHVDELDHVTVGCWGGVVQISDPAFGEDGLSVNLDAAFEAQVEAHPEARITAVCEMYSAATYGKYLAHVPGQPRLSADGWEEQFVTGDPGRLLRAVGVGPGSGPGAECLDPGQDAPFLGVEFLDLLACGLHSTWAKESLLVSVFKVTRSEDVRGALDEVWLQG
ncbi:DUF6333 family protein [Kitasatospora indigofera]|uniref:DUF6333 family protein n=1 Tax=Kitasatospora indigofera TaxID=67307 RepID=UPI00364FDE75